MMLARVSLLRDSPLPLKFVKMPTLTHIMYFWIYEQVKNRSDTQTLPACNGAC